MEEAEKEKEEEEEFEVDPIQQQLQLADEEVEERINFVGEKLKGRADEERDSEKAVALRKHLRSSFVWFKVRALALRQNAIADPANALVAYRNCIYLTFLELD